MSWVSALLIPALMMLPLPVHSECPEPVSVAQGDPAPCSGILMSLDHAAQLAAELTSLRLLVERQERFLSECLADHQEDLDAMLRVCQNELDVCYGSQVDCPEPECPGYSVEEDTPWWLWTAMGVSLAVMFGAGVWIGAELP